MIVYDYRVIKIRYLLRKEDPNDKLKQYSNSTPLDELFRQIERDYKSGRIGISRETDELEPITDIFNQYPNTDLEAPTSYLKDKDDQTHCQYCNTAFRRSEQHDKTRCPFCHKLIDK